jgi:hypothetical protein
MDSIFKNKAKEKSKRYKPKNTTGISNKTIKARA